MAAELEIDDILSDDDFEESSGYSIRLKDFDGPLDTLCHLIKKSKYSLEDVKISFITEQYLEYMKQIDEIDLEKASEFIAMAAWLIEIKSKSLLPKPVFEVEQDDDEKTLKQQVAQYMLFKEASLKLKESETVGIYYKEPERFDERFEIKTMNTSGLMNALQKVFLKLSQKAMEIKERHIVKDRFTVEEKLSHIKDIFLIHEKYNFFDLFDQEITKSEIITTFQAILELLKLQHITAIQEKIYGDIILKRAQG